MHFIAQLIITALTAAGLTWYVLDSRHSAELLQLQLDHQVAATSKAEAYAGALELIRADTTRMQKEKDDALERANQRAQANAAAALAARAESERLLRDLSEAKRRIATATDDALREYATTVSDLYGECEAELTETAAAATGHASDVVTLTEAWPKNDPRPQ